MVKVEIELEDLTRMQNKIDSLEDEIEQCEETISLQVQNIKDIIDEGNAKAKAKLSEKDEIIAEKNQEIEKLKSEKGVLEARITILDDENQEQYEENETLKAQLEEKENKPDKYPYPSPIPEKTEKEQWQNWAKKCRCAMDNTGAEADEAVDILMLIFK